MRGIRKKSLLDWIWSTCQAGFCWNLDLFGTPKHLFLSLPVPSDRLGANVIYALFPQKSFAKKFSKIQGQIILWRSFVKFKSRVRSFLLLTFFIFSYSAFGLSSTDLFTQLSAKNKMIHSVPKSRIQTFNHISFNDFDYTVCDFQPWSFLNSNIFL